MDKPAKTVPLIPARTIITKAIKAAEAGELQFQQRNLKTDHCIYSAPCAVGAGIPKAMRKRIDAFDHALPVGSTKVENFFKTDDIGALKSLQGVHDAFASEAYRRQQRIPMTNDRKPRTNRELTRAFVKHAKNLLSELAPTTQP